METIAIEKYKIFHLELKGNSNGNPYKEAELTAEFSNGIQRICTKGFYKGNGKYEIRFMPQAEGKWEYFVQSNDAVMNGTKGSFLCTNAAEGNHGRVCLKKEVQKGAEVNFYETEAWYQFAYEDGTRFQPFGTTCYAWINQKREVQEQTLETLKKAPFNKVRMCIFPKYYTYNTKNPEMYPFVGNENDGFNLEQFYEPFFENLELRIAQLDELGIEADVILLHPYDCWGFSKMTREQDTYYLSYVVKRLSHFKNIWWSLANEYDLMPWKSAEDWECYARVVMENDPYGHLRSIHNCIPFYNHNRSWITHCSIQRVDVYKTAEMVTEWRHMYGKPVIADECGYEGNIDFGWGNLMGEELVRRYWEGCLRGGYLTHGETYIDKGETIWWSHGGELYGTSVERIAFLKQILSEVPETASPLNITAENHEENWDSTCIHDGEEFYLYYYGFSRPLYRNYTLPEGKVYKLELIDTWNMTIEELSDTYIDKIRIKMPAKQYMAVRMKQVKS